jgi:hypothetical protein
MNTVPHLIQQLDGHDFVPGRLVRYIDANGQLFPMILVTCHKDSAGSNHSASGVIFGDIDFGARFLPNISYDQKQSPNTWHWPLRIQNKKKAVNGNTSAQLVRTQPIKAPPGKPLYVAKSRNGGRP